MTDNGGTSGAGDFRQDDVVEQLIPDPSQPVPAATVLRGYLGKSDKDGYWRLYLTPDMANYVDFRQEDVIRDQKLETDQSLLGGTIVWVRRDASLQYTSTVTREVQAGFLQGNIADGSLSGTTGTQGSLGVEPQPQEIAPLFGTVFMSVLYCPGLTALSYAFCTCAGRSRA